METKKSTERKQHEHAKILEAAEQEREMEDELQIDRDGELLPDDEPEEPDPRRLAFRRRLK